MSHTTGTLTYAVKQHEYAEKHNGEEPDRVTFFTMTHTRGATQLPVDEESARVLAEFKRAEEEVIESGEVVTTEVRNKIFAEVMGPEKRNKVRGYGIGVSWSDVLGIVTEQRGISREVQRLRLAAARAEERINFVRQEAQEADEQLKEEAQEAVEKLKEELRAKQEENLRVAKQQMVEQFQLMLATVGINADMSSMGGHFAQSQQCGSSGPQTTKFGNHNSVQPSRGATAFHDDCQSENSG